MALIDIIKNEVNGLPSVIYHIRRGNTGYAVKVIEGMQTRLKRYIKIVEEKEQ